MPISRQLLVVSTEDSTKLSSWSNVPYLFCKTLEDQGLEIKRLTLAPFGFWGAAERWILRLLKLLKVKNESTWSYSRSTHYFQRAQLQIDQALQHDTFDAVLILSFSYGPSLPSKIPLYLFGDWPLSYAIACHRSRQSDRLEQASIERESRLISAASAVFVLFPLAEKYIKNALPQARTYYLGNVINTVRQPDEVDIKLKRESFSLLFVGKQHYLAGALMLIEAYRVLKKKFPAIVLNIVGMKKETFDNLPDGVFCHGYLDKGDAAQCAQYYTLLRGARVFVNPNPQWASFSAALEAMYFYTPIVTTAYAEIEETFGRDISFGYYYRSNSNQPLHDLIEKLMQDESYESKALNAHVEADKYSWGVYVTRILNVIYKNSPNEKKPD
jgi:glycosyltransferase involved in cell wall biosynthesis